MRVRGTIDRVEGDTYIVKARGGAELKVKLAENAMVVALIKASLADIKQGSYVGVAGMPQADGSQKALEVHIFPEAMRGTGDGHRGWDLQPSSTMTNGNVEQTAAVERRPGADAQVQGRGEEDRRARRHADRRLRARREERAEARGQIFIAAAVKQPDGTLQAPRVNVGREASRRRCKAAGLSASAVSPCGGRRRSSGAPVSLRRSPSRKSTRESKSSAALDHSSPVVSNLRASIGLEISVG